MSACGLLATAYRRAPTALRAELRNLYRDLTHDDTPMVRRAAAANLSKFADAVEPENISKELTTIFHELTQDGELQQVFGLSPHTAQTDATCRLPQAATCGLGKVWDLVVVLAHCVSEGRGWSVG